MRNLAFAIGRVAAVLALFNLTSVAAAQARYGTEAQAKAMLDEPSSR